MSVDVILEDERWSTLDLEGCSQRAFDAVMSHFDLTMRGLHAVFWDVMTRKSRN